MAVMELVDRPGRPLYHVEHYIGGHYILSHLHDGSHGAGGQARQTSLPRGALHRWALSSHIFMMAVIELVDRPGRPLYHVEHYIGGHYILSNLHDGSHRAGGQVRQTALPRGTLHRWALYHLTSS